LSFVVVCHLLDKYPLFYQFVVPSALKKLSKNILISNNPTFCLRLSRQQSLTEDSFIFEEFYPTPVFLQIVCTSELGDFKKLKLDYKARIPIPSSATHFFSDYNGLRCIYLGDGGSIYDGTNSLLVTYKTFDELQSKMYTDLMEIVEMIDLATKIHILQQQNFDIQVLGIGAMRIILFQGCDLFLKYSFVPAISSVVYNLSMRLPLPNEITKTLEALLNVLLNEKAFFVPGMLQDLSLYLAFMVEINQLLNSLREDTGLNLSLEIGHLYSFKVIFGDKMYNFGMQLSFFPQYVLMEDCSFCMTSGYTPLPLYEDVVIQTTKTIGILSCIQRLCNTRVHFGERIIFPSANAREVAEFLQSYIEVVCCILKLHENVPSSAAFEIASLRIMIPSANTQFVFAGSLEKHINAQKNKDKGFTVISAYILEKVLF
jgi:hypothetical protein